MNIFILSPNPSIAAQAHCNQHLSKMILEGAQMICTALEIRGTLPYEAKRLGFYLPTHHNHPCTQWVASDISHAAWLMNLLCELEKERRYRGSKYTHSSLWVAQDAFTFYDSSQGTSVENDVSLYHTYPLPTSWAEAITPLEIKYRPDLDTVAKYQAYYRWKHEKQFKMKWEPRAIPAFISPAHSQHSLALS